MPTARTRGAANGSSISPASEASARWAATIVAVAPTLVARSQLSLSVRMWLPSRYLPNNIDHLVIAAADANRASNGPRVRYYLRMHASSQDGRLPDDQVSLVVEVFRMLADATRVQVLWSLADREMSVNELAEHVGKPAPSVSQHLAKLRMARLVRTRREGTTIFYSLENNHIRQLVVDAVYNAEHAGPGVPQHHRDGDGLRVVDRQG